MDPFSASSKGTQPPPLYQKRTNPRTPERGRATSSAQLPTPPIDRTPRTNQLESPSVRSTPSKQDRQTLLWEETIDKAILEAIGDVDLQYALFSQTNSLCSATDPFYRQQNLTRIPANIADLGKLVILPGLAEPVSQRTFGRVRSSPITRTTSKRSLARSPTMANASAYQDRRVMPSNAEEQVTEIHLLLGSNAISKLPSELFQLRGLTVLSLRESFHRQLYYH